MRKHSGSDEADQSSDAWMAELLQDCGYGKHHRSAKWLAIQANPDVYLEAVETAKDTQEEITRTGAAGLGSL